MKRTITYCWFSGPKLRWKIFIVILVTLALLMNMSQIYETGRSEVEIAPTSVSLHTSKRLRNSASVSILHRNISKPAQPEKHSLSTLSHATLIAQQSHSPPLYTVSLNSSVYEYIPTDFKKNNVQEEKVYFSSTIKKNGPGFTLITMFNLFTGQLIDGYDQESLHNQISRNWEYLCALRENLNHDQIKRVILLYTDVNSLKVLFQQNWVNNSKIYPMKMERLVHMADFFNISSRHLLDEPVIASNGDIVIGENFHKIDTEKLRDTKTLYSLTRHGNKGIGDCKANSMCLMKYYGSHDTHVFRLNTPVSERALNILNYPVNLQQAENGMIGTMSTIGGFTIYNPCSILTTYHIHCSQIAKRLKQGKNSIRHEPWKVKTLRTSRPVKALYYGS